MRRYALSFSVLAVVVCMSPTAEVRAEEEVVPVTIETGTVFLLGERLEPPYVFTLNAGTLWVNSKPLQPVRRKPVRQIVVREETRERYQLLTDCFDVCLDLLEADCPRSAIRDTILHRVEGSALVVESEARGEGTVWVRWQGDSSEEEYIMIPLELPPAPRPWFEVCRENMERYAGYLARGHILIVGAGGEMILPPSRMEALERDLDLLHRFQTVDAEELEILSRDFAREFLDAQK